MASSAAVTNGYAYDGFARQTSATDGRGNVSVTHYNGLGQADWTEDAATNRTVYAYDAFGRQSAVTDPLSNATHTACDSLGNVIRTWGAAYPVEYGYDSQGRKISMKTFRDENGAGDETRWLYDGATGLLTNKVCADNSWVAYAYTPDGKLASRVWARGVTAAYAYDALGQLEGVNYSGATPGVSFGHDRLGRTVSAVTAVSSNIFAYSGLALAAETQNGVTVTRNRDALGRSAGFGLADGFTAAYGYDDFGRMNLVVSGTPSGTNAFRYARLAGADLVGSMTNSAGFWWRRMYEQNRDLIASVENGFGEGSVSGFAYGNDADGRRALRVDSGSVTNLFGYNARSEVTNAVTGTNLFVGAYDGIGNRTAAAWNGSTDVYTANVLNQYACVRSVGLSYDADGNLVSDGVQTCVWDAENRMITTVPAAHSNGAQRVVNGYDHRHRRVLKRVDVLTGYEPAVPPNPPGSPGEWVTCRTTRFVWDNDRIAAEVTVSADGTASTNRYFWGADVSGTLDGAAGVGGLLAASLGGTNVVYCCDANGNVTELLDAYGGGVVARYRYGAFGETLVSEGPLASANPWRFSTRYHDDETGLVMFPRRPYSPQLGRFLSRDPVEEDGGVNLYTICGNDTINCVDPSGLTLIPLDSLGKNGGQLDINVTGESLCVSGKTGKIIYDLTFITPFYVNKYGREHDGELIIDGTNIAVGEPVETKTKVNGKSIYNYRIKHEVAQSECPESDVSGDIDILISWKKTSPDYPNPGTHLVKVKWKYKCKKNTDKDGKKCCAGEATQFTVTIE